MITDTILTLTTETDQIPLCDDIQYHGCAFEWWRCFDTGCSDLTFDSCCFGVRNFFCFYHMRAIF
jgi:hypothetical protein